MEKDLGTLKYLKTQQVFNAEATDFTPWLADHLDLLGQALGIDLELQEREAPVGDFSADLLARDANGDGLVVIENQLQKTDHDHLGKALTYAAGLGASVVVWIATEARPEHRQVIDWLNENTGEGLDFLPSSCRFSRSRIRSPHPTFGWLLFRMNGGRRKAALMGSPWVRHITSSFWPLSTNYAKSTSLQTLGKRHVPAGARSHLEPVE
jgi:hypothetical protein